jgi:hypothetical protein
MVLDSRAFAFAAMRMWAGDLPRVHGLACGDPFTVTILDRGPDHRLLV